MLMLRVIAVLLLLPILAPDLAARSTADWEKVKGLKPGSAIEVLLNDGRYLRGNFYSASDAGLEISVVDRNDPQLSYTHDLERRSIRRIIQIRARHVPDAKRWIITGAVAGGAIGLAGGAIADITHGANYHWLEGGFGGAVAGFFVSCVAAAAAGGVETAKGSRHTTVVYENTSGDANSQRQMVSP